MPPPTIILDIDGCVLEQLDTTDGQGSLSAQILGSANPERYNLPKLPGVVDKFVEWDRKGCRIILMTGRPESCREETVKQLKEHGLFWQQLVMGVGGGPRHLINDCKPDGTKTAFAHCPKRNEGLGGIEI